jgi:magnesium chelatase subunit D
MRLDFPFSAVVGQDDLKLALLLVAVDPTIGGVLITGERGTAKSTAARGIAALLPEAAGGNAAPFVELPLGATEDRVVGSLDISKVLQDGTTVLRSGLLARAHGGVLYVDEVNLLPDHIVDLLLDAAASGWVTVERDGVSATEAARFVLVGTMNPEEGPLRPQFLDRFGLAVQVRGLDVHDARIAAIRQRLAFDDDPAAVVEAAKPAEQALRERIAAARERLTTLNVDDAQLGLVAALSVEHRLDGIRGDLAIVRAARALAAWQASPVIGAEHIHRAAELALSHRTRAKKQTPGPRPPSNRSAPDGERAPDERASSERAPAEPAATSRGRAEKEARAVSGENSSMESPEAGADTGSAGSAEAGAARGESTSADSREGRAGTGAADGAESGAGKSAAGLRLQPAPVARRAESLNLVTDAVDRASVGRYGTDSHAARRVVGAMPFEPTGTLAINETLTKAAQRGARVGSVGVPLAAADLMQHERRGPGISHILFLVDASGSMASQRRLELAKGAALELLSSSYQRRDQVALMIFRAEGTDLVIPFTRHLEGIEQALAAVPTGGRTPLAQGLRDAMRLMQTRAPALLVLLTDGRANVSIEGGDPWLEALAACAALQPACAGAVVIDCERGPIVLGRAGELARVLGAQCMTLDELTASNLTLRIHRRLETL